MAPTAAAAMEARAIELLAWTLCAEAGAAPVRAIEALAALVVNRAELARRHAASRLRFTPAVPLHGPVPWPALIAAACRAPFLFACWRDAASRAALRSAEADPATLAICRRIAARAVAGALPDPTGGATHWHGSDRLPGWALGRVPVAEAGGLVFYRPA
jgi:hypothetical protein